MAEAAMAEAATAEAAMAEAAMAEADAAVLRMSATATNGGAVGELLLAATAMAEEAKAAAVAAAAAAATAAAGGGGSNGGSNGGSDGCVAGCVAGCGSGFWNWSGHAELAVVFVGLAAMARDLTEASELARWARLGQSLRRQAAEEEDAGGKREADADAAAGRSAATTDAGGEPRARRSGRRRAGERRERRLAIGRTGGELAAAAQAGEEGEEEEWLVVDTAASAGTSPAFAVAPPSYPHTPIPPTPPRRSASGTLDSYAGLSSTAGSIRSSCVDADDDHSDDHSSTSSSLASPDNNGGGGGGGGGDGAAADHDLDERSGRHALAVELGRAAEHLLLCLPHELRELMRPIAAELFRASPSSANESEPRTLDQVRGLIRTVGAAASLVLTRALLDPAGRMKLWLGLKALANSAPRGGAVGGGGGAGGGAGAWGEAAGEAAGGQQLPGIVGAFTRQRHAFELGLHGSLVLSDHFRVESGVPMSRLFESPLNILREAGLLRVDGRPGRAESSEAAAAATAAAAAARNAPPVPATSVKVGDIVRVRYPYHKADKADAEEALHGYHHRRSLPAGVPPPHEQPRWRARGSLRVGCQRSVAPPSAQLGSPLPDDPAATPDANGRHPSHARAPSFEIVSSPPHRLIASIARIGEHLPR